LEWFKIWAFIFGQECLSFRTTAEGYDDGGKLNSHGEPRVVEDPMGVEITRGDQELTKICSLPRPSCFIKILYMIHFAPCVFLRLKLVAIYCGTVLLLWLVGRSSAAVHKNSLTGLDGKNVINLLLNKLDEREIHEAFTVARCLWLREMPIFSVGILLCLTRCLLLLRGFWKAFCWLVKIVQRPRGTRL
jgi:hypothetical protein